MGDLTVSGLDETVLAKLGRIAAEHARTVEAEATDIILQELGVTPPTAARGDAAWGKMAQSRRQTGPVDIATIDLLRAAREGEEPDECS
jgi:plasmid stability protein